MEFIKKYALYIILSIVSFAIGIAIMFYRESQRLKASKLTYDTSVLDAKIELLRGKREDLIRKSDSTKSEVANVSEKIKEISEKKKESIAKIKDMGIKELDEKFRDMGY